MNLEEMLVCPVTKSEIPISKLKERGSWQSPHLNGKFFYRNGYFELIPNPPSDQDVLEKWPLWEKLQANGNIAYHAFEEGNLSVGFNPVEKEFADFCQLEGTVLDIGCGPQALPSYINDYAGPVVGIDPLPGSLQRKFAFVKAIGEYLPFRDNLFDRVLFGTSLDHLLSPLRVLKEAGRVLKPNGTICIWYGDHDHQQKPEHPISLALLNRKMMSALKMLSNGNLKALLFSIKVALRVIPNPNHFKDELEVPAGAIDQFHFFHVKLSILEQWLDEAGLRIEQNLQSRKEKSSFFIRAKKS